MAGSRVTAKGSDLSAQLGCGGGVAREAVGLLGEPLLAKSTLTFLVSMESHFPHPAQAVTLGVGMCCSFIHRSIYLFVHLTFFFLTH